MPVCKNCKNYVLIIPCPHCGSGKEFHDKKAIDIKQIVPTSVQAVTRNAPAPIAKHSSKSVTDVHFSLERAYQELDSKGKRHTNLQRSKPKMKSNNLSNDYDFKQNYNDEKIAEFENQIQEMSSSIKTLNSLVKTLIKNNETIIKVISNDYNKLEE